MARDRPLHVLDARRRYGEHLRDDIDPVRGASGCTRVAVRPRGAAHPFLTTSSSSKKTVASRIHAPQCHGHWRSWQRWMSTGMHLRRDPCALKGCGAGAASWALRGRAPEQKRIHSPLARACVANRLQAERGAPVQPRDAHRERRRARLRRARPSPRSVDRDAVGGAASLRPTHRLSLDEIGVGFGVHAEESAQRTRGRSRARALRRAPSQRRQQQRLHASSDTLAAARHDRESARRTAAICAAAGPLDERVSRRSAKAAATPMRRKCGVRHGSTRHGVAAGACT